MKKKLTNQEVKELRKQYTQGEKNFVALAKEYNVSISLVSLICRNERRYDPEYNGTLDYLSSVNNPLQNIQLFAETYKEVDVKTLYKILSSLQTLKYFNSKGKIFVKEFGRFYDEKK